MVNLSKCYLKKTLRRQKSCMVIPEDGLSWNRKLHGN
ncbi:MAG: hypothetical protein PWP41_961 [Moorella sp. (in: firmicutes)]|nr:hypothetical protein [Moorella sp. (in: firmicutes)]